MIIPEVKGSLIDKLSFRVCFMCNDYEKLKEGDKLTISGLHRLPDGSLIFGKPHKENRKHKQPVLAIKEKSTRVPKCIL